ncbi:MAG: DUF1488 domain-containing protein [Gammaproteobacteria bacterium]|nr:DUF1488 domain-containing protein [Gammaproteobacteria bacterium]
MMDIIFAPIEEEDSDLEYIVFNATQGGVVIECAISYQALNEHYEAEYSDPLFAFMMARSEIEKIAEKMISSGQVKDNKLLIMSEHIVQ